MMRPFACLWVLLSACDLSGVRGAEYPPAEICAEAALPGTKCDLLISNGKPPVVSHCWKQDDGSLVCGSDERSASAGH
jgi:hypothetical protein